MTMISSSRIQKFVAVWIVVPCIIGCLISKFILPEGVLQELVEPYLLNITGRRLTTAKENVVPGSSSNVSSNCERNFQNLLGMTSENDPFEGIPVILHRNGEPTSCGDTGSLFLQNLKQNYALGECPAALDKYQVESLLTKTLNDIVETCFATEKNGKKRKNGFLGFCDMGPKNTPILLDHNDLVPVVSPGNKESLPCRFHTREGLQISQLNQLSQMAQAQTQCQLNPNEHEQSCSSEESSSAGSHLYAVPAGRVFMFAPSYVGEIFNLPHVEGSDNKLIYLEVLSLEPRVFDVFNFFSRDESKELVDRAVAEKSESHRIKRSSTGASGYSVNSRRTSESGFDTHGKTATKVKK